MILQQDLLKGIREMENAPQTYQNMQKLATFYTIYEHLYPSNAYQDQIKTVQQEIADYYGDTDFLRLIEGKDAEKLWLLMDELMESVKVLQPRLYDATMQQLKDLL